MSSISLEELHLYHFIDRDTFNRLIGNLSRDIAESLLVMAMWLWLEEKSFPSIIGRFQNLSDRMLAAAANEAVLCLRALESSRGIRIPPNGGLPNTCRIMQKEISLQFFVQNKFTAISGIKILLNKVCARIFTDMLQVALQPGNGGTNLNGQALVIPGFPHPTYGSISIVTHPLEYDFPTGGLWGWDSAPEPQDDRTMFLTFSRGFPVTAEEVTDFFTSLFGDCVDVVQMEGVRNNSDQPLFALMVLRSVSNIDQMLEGKQIAKFKTNGKKHIWARKYEPRE